jgi:hypothetical protein
MQGSSIGIRQSGIVPHKYVHRICKYATIAIQASLSCWTSSSAAEIARLQCVVGFYLEQ